MDEILICARDIATRAHAGQIDRFTGEPYITHPCRVTNRVMGLYGSLDSMIVAMLHDSLEDSRMPELYEKEIHTTFGNKILDYVKIITRREGQTYFSHIRECSNHPVTKIVKLCDVYDHLDFDRLRKKLDDDIVDDIIAEHKGLFKRYEEAKKILEQ